MSAAQLHFDPQDASFAETEGEAGAHASAYAHPHMTTSALKMQAAERLAAHRARRDHNTGRELAGPHTATETPPRHAESRAARIAATVAERYAQSQTYRAFLAAEAERAIEHAKAVAEVAARSAQAVAATQQQLLSELENWTLDDAPESAPMLVETPPPLAGDPAIKELAQTPNVGLTIRLYENVGRSDDYEGSGRANAVPYEHLDEEQRLALDDEIAFRQAPIFDEFLEPSIPIPANLIEFPRQLVASRKARPRFAEGPLREDDDLCRERAQLRIFEVEAEQISAVPWTESTVPEWSSIRLSACTVTESVNMSAEFVSLTASFQTATLGLRLMSTMVDGCIVLASFLGFATVAAYTAGRLPTGQTAALGAAGILAALFLLYQLLFFTFSDATPGMRYARIGLCTFSDENPTHSAMRRRIIAILLAACPLGLGFIWACLDDDRLGWHDRISGMYQRSY